MKFFTISIYLAVAAQYGPSAAYRSPKPRKIIEYGVYTSFTIHHPRHPPEAELMAFLLVLRIDVFAKGPRIR